MIPISEEGLKLRWLAGARWLTILGLLLAFVVGRVALGFTFDGEPFVDIMVILVASNLALYVPTIPPSERLISSRTLSCSQPFSTSTVDQPIHLARSSFCT